MVVVIAVAAGICGYVAATEPSHLLHAMALTSFGVIAVGILAPGLDATLASDPNNVPSGDYSQIHSHGGDFWAAVGELWGPRLGAWFFPSVAVGALVGFVAGKRG
jgi:hypothetical protein